MNKLRNTPRRARFATIVLAAALILVAVLLFAGCDWKQFRYGPAHTGFNPSETRIGPANVSTVRLRWSQSVSTQGIQNPMTIADGVVYAVDWDKVDAFDANTGSARWSSDGIGVGRSAPSVANGAVYVTTDNGLSALDARTGAKLWSSAAAVSAPTVANGVVYVSTQNGLQLPGLDALDATTGAKLWSSTAGGSSPTVANGVVYVVTVGGLDALDATTGAKLWSKVLSYRSFGDPPAVANGVVYVCSFDGLHALKATTGAELWSPRPCNSAPAVANGVVFVGGGELDAYDAVTGARLWWSSDLVSFTGSPTVANGVVYIGADQLYAYDAVTGARLWSAPTPTTSDPEPVIANGVIYMGGNELDAYSLPVTTPELFISPAFDSDFVFGDLSLETRIYTVTNIGSTPTSRIADGLSGPDAAHFRLTSDGCAGTSLAAGASCTVTASFAPTRAGLRSSWLTATAIVGGTAKALLTGTAQPFTISPTSRAFADTFAGMTSTAVFQVTNLTDGPVGPIANAVPPSGYTVAADGCAGKTIAAGTICTIAVNFAPTDSVPYEGTLVADAPGHHAEAHLTGRGLARLELAPSSKDFGSVPVGTTASATFTITNISPIPAGPIAVALGAVYFSLWGGGVYLPFDYFTKTSDNCAGHTVAANASCTFVVNFTPTSPTTTFPFIQGVSLTVSAPLAGRADGTATGGGI